MPEDRILRKKAAICLAVLFVGTLFAAAAKFSAMDKVILGEDGTVVRGSYREGAREIRIGTDFGQQQMDFQVEVEPKRLSAEETEKMFDAFWTSCRTMYWAPMKACRM